MKGLSLLVFVASLSAAQYRVQLTNGKVVELSPEDYVAAVLAGESGTFRSGEALKAMAVAARTYAAHSRGRHQAKGFDFCSTTHCQRAEPGDVTERLRAAATATVGELLWFRGEPAFTVYTKSCGGHSESAAAVWPDLAAPYLVVHPDLHCGAAGWSWQARPDALAHALKESGLQTPERIQNITVLERTTSGRARVIALDGERRVMVSAGSLRFAVGRTLGWNTLRSDQYDVQVKGGTFLFKGRGEGHGIGLCQRGADQMAAEGANYHEILAFYYPGAGPLRWQKAGGELLSVFAADAATSALVLKLGEKLDRRVEARFGWPPSTGIFVYVYPTLDGFRDVTGEPGWVAAKTTGRRIELQPAALLEARGTLSETLEHELLHVAIETHAAPGLPVWFREGLVEWLSDANNWQRPPANRDAETRLSSDTDLRQRVNQGQARAAYRTATAQVRDLANRYGSATVLGWVTRGLPPEVMNARNNEAATKSR